jgi:predicted SAM-dependent methyltransferase
MNHKFKAILWEKIPFALTVAAGIMHLVSRIKIRRMLRQGREVKLELGAGNKSGSGGWLTIDVSSGADLYWDLRRGIPFPNGSVKKIYSSHFFEHLTFGETQEFLEECKRVLTDSGLFSICVPNAKIYIDAYSNGNSLDAETFFVYGPAYNRTTRIDYVNYMAYMGGAHKYMFDEENLIFILKSKGFRNVRLRQFDPGLDLRQRDYESIYAEAVK